MDAPANSSSGRQTIRLFSGRTALDIAIISLLWLLAEFAVGPIGEFPLNDDWSYSLAAKRLVEGAGYQPTGWTEMNLFSHALWGTLFCLPSGFSFTALRLSTLSLSLIGVLGMYGLIRQLNRSRLLAFLCAAGLAFNPIYFALSNTFMADVPFTTWSILSAWFFVRHLQRDTKLDLWLGTSFALVATLSRQMGLFLPVGFGVAAWLKPGNQRPNLIKALLPLAVCVSAHLALRYWLHAADKTPAATIMAERLWAAITHPHMIPVRIVYFGWSILMYLGWFLLPVTIFLLPSWQHFKANLFRLSLVSLGIWSFLLMCVGRFTFMPKLMPVHNNIISPEGIGPATLRDIFTLKLPHLPALPTAFWLAVTAMSLAGAILVVFELTTWLKQVRPRLRSGKLSNPELIGVFFGAGVVVYLLPFIISGFFDRYLLPTTAFLMAFLAITVDRNISGHRGAKPYVACIALAMILFSGLFGVAATKDYFAWNRTRWMATRALLAQEGKRPDDVDGGFEVNGWYLFQHQNQPERWGNTPAAIEWAGQVPYVIAFGEIPGFETAMVYSYKRWLLPAEGKIFVLKRIAQ